MVNISIILPTFNEMNTGVLTEALPKLCSRDFCEIIAVDRESSDGTLEFLKTLPVKIISTKLNTRAERLNLGIKHSCGEMILLHHPRSSLPIHALDILNEKRSTLGWGAFTHEFDFNHFLLRLTSWYSNKVRGDLSGIYYLDHCIYLHRRLIGNDQKLVPELDVFEDTALCQKLLKIERPLRLAELSTTSSIRFLRNGIYRQAFLNQLLKLGYKAHISPRVMNKIYERGLSLNSKY